MVEEGKLIEVYKYIVLHMKRYGDTYGYLESALVSIEAELNLLHSEFRASESRPLQLSERMSKGLIGVVHRAVGLASRCWSNIDGAGTFDAKEAEDIAVELCYVIADEIEAERECGSILRLSEVAVIEESEEDSVIQHFDSREGDIR